jgi:hypothetical protein
MIDKINQAFNAQMALITPTIQTSYEGVSFTPTSGTPYQELYIIPALNNGFAISSPNFISSGIFQITLKYPSGVGLLPIMERVNLYMQNFKKDMKLTKDGYDVYISDAPKYVNLGKDGDRVIFAVSINYNCFVSMV